MRSARVCLWRVYMRVWCVFVLCLLCVCACMCVHVECVHVMCVCVCVHVACVRLCMDVLSVLMQCVFNAYGICACGVCVCSG
jgi:hypothetical protein